MVRRRWRAWPPVLLMLLLLGAWFAPSAAAQDGDATTTTDVPAPEVVDPGAEVDPEEPVVDEAGVEVEQGFRIQIAAPAGADADFSGVAIRISKDDAVVAEAITDEDGRAVVALDAVGRHEVLVDATTLPEGYQLAANVPNPLTPSVAEGKVRPVNLRVVAGDGITTGGTAGPAERGTNRFAQTLVDGIKFGLIIGMCAIGLSLIFGTTGLTNFAHGEMVTFGAIMAWFLNQSMGLPFVLAALFAVLLGAGFGLVQDLAIWRRLRGRGTSLIAQLVISIGLALVIRYVYVILVGGRNLFYRITNPPSEWLTFLDGFPSTATTRYGPVALSPADIMTIALAVFVLVGVGLFLQNARMGKALRAVADNRDLASASGIDVNRVITVVWCLGGALAALGGVLQGLSDGVSWLMGLQLLLLIFAGVTLGGLGTAYGALVGSLIVGLFVQLSTLVIPSELKNVGALLTLIVILVIRPQGILGRSERVG